MKRLLFLFLFFVLCIPAVAQDRPCDDASSEVDRKGCLRQLYEQADRELNRVYQMAIASIRASTDMPEDIRKQREDLFREAERHWIGLKEAECELVAYDYYPGNGGDVATRECLLEKTKARTEELKKQFGIL